jgi:signal transduction histidine kinase
MWIVGDGGISKIGTDGHESVIGDRVPWRRATSAVIDESDHLWVGTTIPPGILVLSLSEFEKTIQDKAHDLNHWVIDHTDGLDGLIVRAASPNALRTADGVLLFVTSGGIIAIDPRVVTETYPPNDVRIESVTADGQLLPATASLQVAPGSVRVAIDYTVLNFAAPLKHRFRYRLEGLDDHWMMAGAQRQAIYTNLPPGRYEFTVQTTNGDGSWNEPGSTLVFSVQPLFLQTASFKVFAVATLALMAFGLWRVRAQQMRRRVTLVMNERLRLSREIHDTLLQGLAGVALQFEVLSRRAEPAARQKLEQLQDFIEESLSDARRAVWNLRSSADEAFDLAAALRLVGDRAADEADLDVALSVTGTPRPCDRNLEYQMFRIGQEAVTNTVRHAQATHLRMELNYAVDRLTLRISDDGRGFDARVSGSNGVTRFGLKGMKERCELVGGRFEIRAKPGSGTLVEVSVGISTRRAGV